MSEIFDFINAKFNEERDKFVDIHGTEGIQIITAEVDEAFMTMQNNQFDVIVCDPPYGVNINPKWDKNMPPANIWAECSRVLKPGGHCIIFGQPSMSQEFFNIMEQAKVEYKSKLEYRDTWIWAYQGTHTKGFKTEDSAFRSKIRNIYNPIYIYRKELEGTEEENWEKYKTNLLNIDDNRQEYKGNHASIIKKYEETGQAHLQSKKPSNTFSGLERKGWVPNKDGAEPTNIQYCPRATKAERTINEQIENKHETIKPVSIMLWLVGLLTNNKDQTVLDCFMGTGSTGMACRLLGRKFIGIDNDVEMAKLANFRINNVFELDQDLFIRRSI